MSATDLEKEPPVPAVNRFHGVMAEMLAKRNASSISRSSSLKNEKKSRNEPNRSETLKAAKPTHYKNVMDEMLKKKLIQPLDMKPQIPRLDSSHLLDTTTSSSTKTSSRSSPKTSSKSSPKSSRKSSSNSNAANPARPNKPIRRNSQKSRNSSGNRSPSSSPKELCKYKDETNLTNGCNGPVKANHEKISIDSGEERIQTEIKKNDDFLKKIEQSKQQDNEFAAAIEKSKNTRNDVEENVSKSPDSSRKMVSSTPIHRRDKDERRLNYEKRRDQRRRDSHSSDKEIKSTANPKKPKKAKHASRRQSTQQLNDEASPTELDKTREKCSQSTLERRNMLRSLPLSSSSSDESANEDSLYQDGLEFKTFKTPLGMNHVTSNDNDSSKLSAKIAKLKEDGYAKRLHELNTSLVIKLDPDDDEDDDDENRPFIKEDHGDFTYLDADEELLQPFEDLGWFDGRPIYFWTEAIIILLYGLDSIINWLAIIMCLAKVIIGMIGDEKKFIFQCSFTILGFLHLLTLPLLDNFEFIRKSKLLLRHSKTSKLLRKILSNWENRCHYYLFNLVKPWNTLVFCRNYNNQRRVLERQLNKTSSFVTRLTKQKIKNLKIIQDRLLFTSSCYRDPFQFFIGYNLFIQVTGNDTLNYAVSTGDVNHHYFDKLLITTLSISLLLNLFFIFFNLTQRIGAWYEAKSGQYLQYGSRTLYLITATGQALVVIIFCNLEHEDFFSKHMYLQSQTSQILLGVKIGGLIILNIVIFTVHVFADRTTRYSSFGNKVIVIFRRSFSSILFWTQDLNNDKCILPTKDIIYFVFYMLIRIVYIILLWIFVDGSLVGLPNFDMENRNSTFISVMVIASLVCIAAQLLLYFVLKDDEFCKKILLYIMTFIFFSSIVTGMFRWVPRSNHLWKDMFNFN